MAGPVAANKASFHGDTGLKRDLMKARKAKRQRRPQERPGEILDAALKLFTSQGYSNTSIDAIAAQAGVTKGAIYHHFKTKEDILAGAVEACFEKAFAKMDSAH